MNKQEYLANGGLDFTVSKRKMLYEGANDNTFTTPFFCTVNDKTKESLGPVRSRYTIIQNADLLDNILDKLEPGSYNLDDSRCGMFKGGRKIYFFIRLNQGLSIGSDAADVYLYALSSHDGSQRLVYGISTRMHSCSNMFGILMSDKDNNHVVKHTKRINKQDGRFINEMVNRNTEGLVRLFNVMRQNEAPLDFREYFLNIVGKIDGKKRVSTVIKDRRKDLLESIESEMVDKGPTYYGLFNGLTHYLTHKHREYTNWSAEYEMLIGNSNDYVKSALSQIVKNMQTNGISLN
tara:strand:- start:3318 stop:4193 length:876 start_codon:yes stop_codon:yes gene_type:complete